MMKSFAPRGRHTLTALCSLILATQLAACGGSSGGSSTTPPPSGNNPPPQTPPPPPVVETVSLKLTGKVTDEPIPNAEVTATIGEQTFTTTAGADGSYSLDMEIEEADAAGFVTLSARGVGDQAFVEFTSLVGSFQSLAAQAGDDGTLSASENFATQITNVSTAQAVFMQQANGDQPISSDALLQSLASQINAQDVFSLAAAIKLAVDDPANNPLPEGQTSILALASDPTARQSFVNTLYENNRDAFIAAQVAIAQDPNLTQPLESSVIEGYLENEGFTTGLLSSDAAFTFNYTGRVQHFNLGAGGVGSESSETYEQSFTWQLDGSSIQIAYEEPVVSYSWDSVTCGSTFAQYQGRYVTEGATISFLNARTVAITTTSDVTYAACPQLDNPALTTTSARTVLSMDDFDVIDMTEKYGQAQTIYVWDSTKNEVVADVAEISENGTGRTLLTGLTFEWAFNADGGPEEEGKIVQVEFSNGTQAQYLSIHDIDDLASDLFWEINTPSGDVLMGAGASIFADPDYAVTEVTEADVVGRYYQFGVGDEVSGDSRLKGFRMRFDADGTGAQEEDFIDDSGNVVTLNEDSPNEEARAFRWSIVPDNGVVGVEVVVRRTINVDSGEYNCVYDNGATPACVLFDERRIMPIVVNDTGRYYWIEVRRMDPLEVTSETPATHLARFYDYEPLEAEQAVSMAKPRVSRDANKPRELLRGPALR